MRFQNNIRIIFSIPFVLGVLFLCLLSGKSFSQDNSGNVYNYVQQKSQLEKAEVIQSENSGDKKNRFIGYSNGISPKPSKSKEVLLSESVTALPQIAAETEETSTLSLNVFLYVLDKFKEE
ncbi:hypothetical protein [Cyclobacterium qasimii]|uniref:Uncharacterized protein n=2 Tax=Cyclobacterium qasimii TaxID=1350429 RepID=S7V873_9BACT|nr:hypothetical protein [Cyclobacterium qasimii]EPR66121.1 hypothetical protein ADICYQ_4819 [Cyclobacterium qasimii M12-11B]GEO21233.1 hypothetical protein CQA01_17670 [Cyclobacterium qasimii]